MAARSVMEQWGRITATDDEYMTVLVCARQACARCADGRGCDAGMLSSLLRRDVQLRLPRQPGAEPGQRICLGLEARRLLILAAATYLTPLALLLAILAMGRWIFPEPSALADVLIVVLALAAGLAGMTFGGHLGAADALKHVRPVRIQGAGSGIRAGEG